MIRELCTKIADGLFEFSEHAVDQSIIRHISAQEIREAFANSQIIWDYPDDKYGPSCLVLGSTLADRPLHILCRCRCVGIRTPLTGKRCWASFTVATGRSRWWPWEH